MTMTRQILRALSDGAPLSAIQLATIIGSPRRNCGRNVDSMCRRGLVAVRDHAGGEMATKRYLGARYVITPAGVEKLTGPAPEAKTYPGETTVQCAIRTQVPYVFWLGMQ